MRPLKVNSSGSPLLTITRSSRWSRKMVYILAANKHQKYANGRSRVIYIGTTKKGASRPAASAVSKASQAFGRLHGVKTIEVYVATCRPRKAMKTWEYLESALLDTFRMRYFELPKYNRNRPKVKDGLFAAKRLSRIIDAFGTP